MTATFSKSYIHQVSDEHLQTLTITNKKQLL